MSGVQVTGLSVTGPNRVMVEPFDVRIAAGQTLAIIGESGSGKTLSAKSLIGLLPRGFRAAGSLQIGDRQIALDGPAEQWPALRGQAVALLLQDPFTSLSPVHRCGPQIAWTLTAARGRIARGELDHAVQQRLAEVKLPGTVAAAYPHQLSGGMRQRVAIAAALAADPLLLIADEPTTALDASNQAEILDLLRTIQDARELSVILISHDLGLVRGRSEDVLVMQHGVVVERGSTSAVLSAPQHPYTRALIEADPSLATRAASTAEPPGHRAELVQIEQLTKHFGERTILDGVDLRIKEREIVGLVGESGSGKSTLARCLAGLIRPDAGTIRFGGFDLAPGRASRTPDQMQIVFQDPYSSLNPMMSVKAILAEALAVAGRPGSEVPQLLQTVGLPADFASKRPAQLSGGERQRVAIARALAPRPQLLICDESVSALDVSVQAQILALINQLRDDLGISILFISHDLAVVRILADSVTVLQQGRVVEQGTCQQVLTHPQQDYTRLLVAAADRENASAEGED